MKWIGEAGLLGVADPISLIQETDEVILMAAAAMTHHARQARVREVALMGRAVAMAFGG